MWPIPSGRKPAGYTSPLWATKRMPWPPRVGAVCALGGLVAGPSRRSWRRESLWYSAVSGFGVAAIATRTFAITRTLIRLGDCRGSTDLSLAVGDPSAVLVETNDACGRPYNWFFAPAASLEVAGPTARQVL